MTEINSNWKNDMKEIMEMKHYKNNQFNYDRNFDDLKSFCKDCDNESLIAILKKNRDLRNQGYTTWLYFPEIKLILKNRKLSEEEKKEVDDFFAEELRLFKEKKKNEYIEHKNLCAFFK